MSLKDYCKRSDSVEEILEKIMFLRRYVEKYITEKSLDKVLERKPMGGVESALANKESV